MSSASRVRASGLKEDQCPTPTGTRRRCSRVAKAAPALFGGPLLVLLGYSSSPWLPSPHALSPLAWWKRAPVAPAADEVAEELFTDSSRDREDFCGEFPWVKPSRVLHSNLGHHGPDKGAEGIVYKARVIGRGAEMYMGRWVLLMVNATTTYSPSVAKLNGLSGEFFSVNIKSGSAVGLRIRMFDAETMEVLQMPQLALTFFDLDHGHHKSSIEHVSAGGYHEFLLSHYTEVKTSKTVNGVMKFEATTYGNGEDNPKDGFHMTSQQMNRAITLTYLNAAEILVEVGATPGMTPRFFTFVFRPALVCSLSEDRNYLEQEEGVNGTTPMPSDERPVLYRGPGTDVVVSPEEGVFWSWYVRKGDLVRKGTTIATVNVHGKLHALKASKKGVVQSLQEVLNEGDEVEKVVRDRVIAVVGFLPPLRRENSRLRRVIVYRKQTFLEYVAGVGDIVRWGDPIARLSSGGMESVLKAPYSGVVSAIQERLERGDELDNLLSDHVVALLGKLPPLRQGQSQQPVVVPHKSIFGAWLVRKGDCVRKGDLVATVDTLGADIELKAPMDGIVTAIRWELQDGDDVGQLMEDQNLAMIGKLAPLKVGPGLLPIIPTAGCSFVAFKCEVGDTVHQGDDVVIAKCGNSSLTYLKAPKHGVVNSTQTLLKVGMNIDQVMVDRTLAVVGPFPALEPDKDSLAVRVPSGSTFLSWMVHAGDFVRKGSPICQVQLPNRRLESGPGRGGTNAVITAPEDGVVHAIAPLEPGNVVDDTIRGGTVAMVRPGSPQPGAMDGLLVRFWPWPALLAAVAALVGVGFATPRCSGPEEGKEAYTRVPDLARELEAGSHFSAHSQMVRTPSATASATAIMKKTPTAGKEIPEVADEGLRLIFKDETGMPRTVYSRYRPLGIKMQHTTPIVVEDYKCNSYAKAGLQVEKGWTLTQIGETDVSEPGRDFQEVLHVLNLHQCDMPVWPLSIDFVINKETSEVKSFRFSYKPIGIEFTNKAPITVKKVHSNSPAARKGIKKGWVVTRIGDRPQAEDLEFRVLMKLLKEGVEPLQQWDPKNKSMVLNNEEPQAAIKDWISEGEEETKEEELSSTGGESKVFSSTGESKLLT